MDRKESSYAEFGSRSSPWAILLLSSIWARGDRDVRNDDARSVLGLFILLPRLAAPVLEGLQETLTVGLLCYFNLWCLLHLDEHLFYAPLTVFVHGMVDFLHHLKLHPTEKHVIQQCPKYPIMCGCLDVAFAFTMGLMILLFSS
jgi:hypothetical protein